MSHLEKNRLSSDRNFFGSFPRDDFLRRFSAWDLAFFKRVFHLANLFTRTDNKVGTVPTCSWRNFSPTNFNQSRCRILVFASRRANNVAKWKTGFNLFSSSVSDAKSSDSYSSTTSHPSLLLSAIFINFCRFFMVVLASLASCGILPASPALFRIRERILSSLALNSNCFLLPLHLNFIACFSIVALFLKLVSFLF